MTLIDLIYSFLEGNSWIYRKNNEDQYKLIQGLTNLSHYKSFVDNFYEFFCIKKKLFEQNIIYFNIFSWRFSIHVFLLVLAIKLQHTSPHFCSARVNFTHFKAVSNYIFSSCMKKMSGFFKGFSDVKTKIELLNWNNYHKLQLALP